MLVSARCAGQYSLCYCVYSALIIISDWYLITVTVKLTSHLMLVSARCACQYSLCYCVYSTLIVISDWYCIHCHC